MLAGSFGQTAAFANASVSAKASVVAWNAMPGQVVGPGIRFNPTKN